MWKEKPRPREQKQRVQVASECEQRDAWNPCLRGTPNSAPSTVLRGHHPAVSPSRKLRRPAGRWATACSTCWPGRATFQVSPGLPSPSAWLEACDGCTASPASPVTECGLGTSPAGQQLPALAEWPVEKWAQKGPEPGSVPKPAPPSRPLGQPGRASVRLRWPCGPVLASTLTWQIQNWILTPQRRHPTQLRAERSGTRGVMQLCPERYQYEVT